MASFALRANALGWRGDVESELRSLAISLSSELDLLRTNCEAARLALADRLSAALTAVQTTESEPSLRDDRERAVRETAASLARKIDSVEAEKTVSIEAEQVHADAVLETAVAVLTALRVDDASAKDDAGNGVVALLEALASLPHTPLEPSTVRLDADPSRSPLGRLVVVRVARAADVRLAVLGFAIPGKPLQLTVTLSDAFGACDEDDVPATLAHLARHLRSVVVNSVDGADAVAATRVIPDARRSCVIVTIELLPSLSPDSGLEAHVYVAGSLVATVDGHSGLSIPFYRGIPPGLSIADSVDESDEYSSPVVSANRCVVYKVRSSSYLADAARNVFACDGDGFPSKLPRCIEALLPTNRVSAIATVNGPGGPTILVGRASDTRLLLSAFAEDAPGDGPAPPEAPPPLWELHYETNGIVSGGMSVLPHQGIVVVGKCSSLPGGALFVVDLASGRLLASCSAHYAWYLAGDAASGTVFASVNLPRGEGPYANSFGVAVFRWDGTELVPQV